MRCHRHSHRRSWTTLRWTTSCLETRSRCHPPQTPRHEWHSPRRVDAAQDGEARWYHPTEAPRALPRHLPCRRMAARGACVASGSTSMQTRKSRSSREGEKKGQGREAEAVGSCSCIAGGVVGRRGRKIRIFSKGLDSKAGHTPATTPGVILRAAFFATPPYGLCKRGRGRRDFGNVCWGDGL